MPWPTTLKTLWDWYEYSRMFVVAQNLARTLFCKRSSICQDINYSFIAFIHYKHLYSAYSRLLLMCVSISSMTVKIRFERSIKNSQWTLGDECSSYKCLFQSNWLYAEVEQRILLIILLSICTGKRTFLRPYHVTISTYFIESFETRRFDKIRFTIMLMKGKVLMTSIASCLVLFRSMIISWLLFTIQCLI